MKVNFSTNVELVELVDTETAKLATNFNNIVKLVPVCAAVKDASIKALHAWPLRDYTKNIKDICLKGEQRERKVANARGLTTRDPKESEGGGRDSKARWAAAQAALLTHEPYYGIDLG